jgi:hypothetical protein
MSHVLLWLDDVRNPTDGQAWTICRTVAEAKALLLAGPVDYASLDHDLGMDESGEIAVEAPTGYDLVKWMAEHDIWPKAKPWVHSSNPAGRFAMRQAIDRYWSPR